MALFFAALSASALPLAPSLMAPGSMGVADRDIVRDPWGALAGALSAPMVIGGPTQVAFAPVTTVLAGGGGGFGGGYPTFNYTMPRSLAPDFTTPRTGGVFFALVNPAPQSNIVIGAVQVPDGGMSVAMLGATLLGLILLRRHRESARAHAK